MAILGPALTAGAQTAQPQWVVNPLGPTTATDSSKLMHVDAATGDVYLTGQSTLVGSETALTTWKYNNLGQLIWMKQWTKPLFGTSYYKDYYGVAIRYFSGQVAVTGVGSKGPNGADYVTILYNAADGSYAWPAVAGEYARIYNNPDMTGDDIPVDVEVNLAGVYVTGSSQGPQTAADILTIAYGLSNGQPFGGWPRRFDSFAKTDTPADLQVFAVADPGTGAPDGVYLVGTTYLDHTQVENMLTLAYNPDGTDKWSQQFNGGSFDIGMSIDLQNVGSLSLVLYVFVTGTWYDPATGAQRYVTQAYYAVDGQFLWEKYFGSGAGSKHTPRKVDGAKVLVGGSLVPRVFVTGESWNGSNYDFGTVCYDAFDGSQIWDRVHDIAFGEDRAVDLVVPGDDFVYVVGTSFNGVNFDYATMKYRADNGLNAWLAPVRFLGSGGEDTASAIAVVPDPSSPFVPFLVTVTGRSATVSGTAYATVRYVQLP